MNIKRILFGIGLFLTGGLMLGSCTKNDENTIALIGTEYYIDDILSVVPTSLQEGFFAEFGSIPEGPIPPKIEGEFVVGPRIRIGTNVPGLPVEMEVQNAYLRFAGQHNGVVGLTFNEAEHTYVDTVFVCGNGNDFAVYYIENMAFDLENNHQVYNVEMKRGVIMKGKITETGLVDFRYATIVIETDDEEHLLADPGSYYIYKDGDGNAECFDW